MKNHHFFKIEWLNFPIVNRRRVSGCYMIGRNIYIGASVNIRKRILAHCSKVYCQRDKEFLSNTYMPNDLYNYLYNCIKNNNPIYVVFLSDNVHDEQTLLFQFKPNQSLNINYHKVYNQEGKRWAKS